MIRRLVFAIALLLLSVPVYAYETSGKFGIGAGFSLIPFLPNANMKYWITNIIGVSPSFTIFTATYSDPYGSTTGNLYSLGLDTYIPIIRAERANFNIKVGGYYLTSNENLFNTKVTALNFGFGIEHFVNDNFSLYIGARSMYILTKPSTNDNSSTTIIGLTSQFLDFSITNYLK